MSFGTYFNPSQKTVNSYVGGRGNKDYDDEYIRTQKDILSTQNHKSIGKIPDKMRRYSRDDIIQGIRYGGNQAQGAIDLSQEDTTNDKYHKYNPFYDYLKNNGLLKENFRIHVNTTYLNIDSSSRAKVPNLIPGTEITLEKNPLSYTTSATTIGTSSTIRTILRIQYPNHPFTKNDRLVLTGLEKTTVAINTKMGPNDYAVIFTPGSLSVAFKCNYDVDPIISPMSFDPNFSVGAGILETELKSYDTSDMTVTISGFDVDNNGNPAVGNIPINFLNSTHRMYLSNPDYIVQNGTIVYSPNVLINVPVNGTVKKITGFYILLNTKFNGIQPTSNMTLTLSFNHFGGIPTNTINAEFPIDQDHLLGYHQIYDVNTNTIDILMSKTAYYKDLIGTTEINRSFGGNNIIVSTIAELTPGYSTPNKYMIELPNIYQNVIMAKLVSTTFPNTSRVFSNNPDNRNNRLYWQNQDDGDIIYMISLPDGNYDPDSLAKAIESYVYKVPRLYTGTGNSSTNYTSNNFFNVTIDTITNIVTIKSYKEAKLTKPIQDVSPMIDQTSIDSPPYTLTILQTGHGLSIGDTVLFTGMISTLGIPDTVLNTTHIVTSVPSLDNYTIVIDNFNLNSGSRPNTGGGFAAKAYIPNSFRLLFDKSDTMGNQLGFRNVGNSTSITKYNTVITNVDPYQNETIFTDTDGVKYVSDESGNKLLLKNNNLKLSGYDYVLMVIREFSNVVNISGNKKITSCFAKINLSGLPGKLVYDTFVQTPSVLFDPIYLSELNISFYSPDGVLFEFNGVDHSFVIEITSLDYLPLETGIIAEHTIF